MSVDGRRAWACARRGFACALSVLAACTTPPDAPGSDAKPSDVAPSARAAVPALKPLARQPALPPDAPPRSQVPSALYELSRSVPDDGVPGDEGLREIFERGGASWYGIQFHQRKTANGERFDMTAFTAAHKTLPFNTRVCVRSLVNGREVMVRINDRGPYASGRIIDLSRAAAESIGLVGLGIKQVALSIVDKENLRCAGAEVDSSQGAGATDYDLSGAVEKPSASRTARAKASAPNAVPPSQRR